MAETLLEYMIKNNIPVPPNLPIGFLTRDITSKTLDPRVDGDYQPGKYTGNIEDNMPYMEQQNTPPWFSTPHMISSGPDMLDWLDQIEKAKKLRERQQFLKELDRDVKKIPKGKSLNWG